MVHLPETVHIIPLGHEMDRAVRVFESSRVNRVHLLALTESKTHDAKMIERQVYFRDLVKRSLEKKGIEVKCRNVDMFNILEVMRNITEIILSEKAENNFVHVNISACGRLTSIGATLAAMAHDAIVYYVIAERYSEDLKEIMKHGLSICEKGDVIRLQNFKLRLPDENSQKILVQLLHKEKGMKTKEIEEILRKSGVEGFEKDYTKMIGEEKRRTQIRYLMRLNKGILDKLERDGYIARKKIGRYNTIEITDSGKYVAYISGLRH